jgi:hypothetical protein
VDEGVGHAASSLALVDHVTVGAVSMGELASSLTSGRTGDRAHRSPVAG